MENNKSEFIQSNSPDGGFLQSEEWRNFQETAGRKTFHLEGENFWANIVEHKLPITGKYFYIPRGPLVAEAGIKQIEKMIYLAKEKNAGWIRFDANSSRILELVRSNWRILKAPHDMQPKEIFAIDITKLEEQLLSEMKSKTRYNIRLAEKKNIQILSIDKKSDDKEKYLDGFLRLVRITSERQGITPHPDNYYRQMFETLPNLKLYVAEHAEKVIVANLVLTFGTTATYLHGASDDKYKNLMAPYLLQWKQIQDAKAAGCVKYDFGGVKSTADKNNDWAGITRFKTGFSPSTKPIEFPGSYDIILNPVKYKTYRIIQNIKSWL